MDDPFALLDRALADQQRRERDNETALYDDAARWELVRQARAALTDAAPILRWFSTVRTA
jgi:hypothetical protein